MTNRNRIMTYWLLATTVFILFCMTVITNQKAEIVELSKLNIEQKIYYENQYQNELNKQQLKLLENEKLLKMIYKKRVLTEKDLINLQKITYVEARGEGLLGQASVASSILTRWLRSNKSMKQIIEEKGQFPISNKIYKKAEPNEETIKAVNLALIKDYTYQSEFYLNKKESSRSNIRWFENKLKFVTRRGNHWFYKK